MRPAKNTPHFIHVKFSILLLSIFLCTPSLAKNFVYQFIPEDFTTDVFMHLKTINSLGMSESKINGIAFNELSGLGWDEQRKLLYAISDSGALYHIKIVIKQGKIIQTKVVRAYQLRDKKGKVFSKKYSDSEGLSLKRNRKGVVTELIISFERKFRIARFNLEGKFIGDIQLPNNLRNKKNYHSRNKGLESVTQHPKFGVITAAELPLKTAPKHYQSLYSSKGRVWHFKQSLHRNSSVTGLEILPNGDILVLERAYSGLFSPMVISLRQVKLSTCNQQHQCKVEDLAVFNSIDGWRIDNFEGLTHYKDNQYLMVSDDNKNPLQSTVLVLFEIKH
jgi:hypothetical protein